MDGAASVMPRFRRFGDQGPVYEVLEDKGEVLRIRVVETGETLDYRKDRADRDPPAH